MKKLKLLYSISFLLCSVMLSSCAVIGGIFKAGMGFGIFLVITIVVVIVFIVMKAGKNKS